MKFRLAPCLLALLLCIETAGAAAVPVLTQVYTAPYVMSAAADGDAQLQLPLTVAEGHMPANLCVEKIGARFQNLIDQKFIDRFQVEGKLAVTPNGGPPVLRIKINQLSSLAPGDYQLFLSVYTCAGDKAGTVHAPLVLQLNWPYVKIEAPSKIVIDRRLLTPWNETADQLNPAHLKLTRQEDGSAIRTFAPSIEASTFIASGSGTNVGRWAWSPPTPNDAGGAEFKLAPAAFPVGTATGQFIVRSKDLQLPLKLEVEVHSRLVSGWILLTVFLGLLTGYGLRIYLQKRIDLGKSLQIGWANLRSYRADRDNIPDDTFVKATQASLDKLLAAIDARDKAAIDTAITEAKAAFEQARQNLNISLADRAREIGKFRDTFDVTDPLPTEFRAACEAALRTAESCTALLNPPNPTGAGELLEKQQKSALSALAEARMQLELASSQLLASLAEVQPLLSTAERNAPDIHIPDIGTDMRAMPAPTDLVAAGVLLPQVAQLQRGARQRLQRAANALESSAIHLDQQIADREPARGQFSGERATLKTQLAAIAAEMRTQAAALPFSARSWPGLIAPAAKSVQQLLLQLLASRTDLDPVVAAELKQVITGGDWYAIFDEISLTNPMLGPATQTQVAAINVPLPLEITPQQRIRDAIAAQQVAAFSTAHIDAAMRETRQDVQWSECLMTLAVAVLLTGASFAVYEDKFVGSWSELLGLFIWGFSADLTADKLAEKIRAIGPR